MFDIFNVYQGNTCKYFKSCGLKKVMWNYKAHNKTQQEYILTHTQTKKKKSGGLPKAWDTLPDSFTGFFSLHIY